MSVLIYAKLDPGTGNATSAARLAAIVGRNHPVILRGLVAGVPEDDAALACEVAALRALAAREQLTLAIGIHCYRAGAVLDAAFAGSLPYVLIASGTDLNVDRLDGDSRQSPPGDSLRSPHRDSLRSQKKPINATLCQAIAHASALIALSPELHDKAALLAELPAEQRPPLTLIPQAPDFATSSTHSLRSMLHLAPDQKLILLPAGIRAVKGVTLAIDSMAPALLEHPDHVFAIVGPVVDRDYHGRCEARISAWQQCHPGLVGQLHLLDSLPRPDYLAVLRETDLLLNTSESEAVANAVLEAQGAGVPVLARDIPGNRAAITTELNGWLFTDRQSFLTAYRRIFAEPAVRGRIIAAGRKNYRRSCNPDAEALAYRQLLADVFKATAEKTRRPK